MSFRYLIFSLFIFSLGFNKLLASSDNCVFEVGDLIVVQLDQSAGEKAGDLRLARITAIDFEKDPVISFETHEDLQYGEILLSKAELFNLMGLKRRSDINFMHICAAFDAQLANSKFKFLQDFYKADCNQTSVFGMSHFKWRLSDRDEKVRDGEIDGTEIEDLDELISYLEKRKNATKRFEKDIDDRFPQRAGKIGKAL